MCKACNYTIHGAQHHFGWDNSLPPALRAEPGSTILFHCNDSSAGQLGPSSTVADVVSLDFGKINPVSGPIYLEGAEPGDAVKVTIESFAPRAFDGAGFGWTANIPGFGLLADQFTDPALHVWKYDPASMAPALWGTEGRVPLKPFAGTIGNALAEPGLHSVVPPRRVGGKGQPRQHPRGPRGQPKGQLNLIQNKGIGLVIGQIDGARIGCGHGGTPLAPS